MVKVTVQWGAKTFPDVEVQENAAPEVLKCQLWTLSGVPPERQKVMVPGKGLLRDNLSDLTTLKLKQGSKLMLVGTAEGEGPKPPAEKPVFLEDLTAEEKAKLFKEKKAEVYPSGLVNLGTTCYLNSLIQFLRPVEGFSDFVKTLPGAFGNPDPQVALCGSFRELYKQMESTVEAVHPIFAVEQLRRTFPQFARKSDSGAGYMQQDAEECFSELMEAFKRHSINPSTHKSPIDEMFQIAMESRVKNIETDAEPEEVKKEHVKLLSCHLGSPTSPVDHMHSGIQLSLQGTIEKTSPVLDRLSQYMKTSRIASLPPNLVVHFVRFEWKAANALARTEATRAKIVRRVNFSRRLDLYEFCSDSLKKDLRLGRTILQSRNEADAAERNKVTEAPKNDKTTAGASSSSSSSAAPATAAVASSDDVAMSDRAPETETVSAQAQPTEGEEDVSMSSSSTSLEPMATGNYELCSIITHQGRTAEGGHYVCWLKHSEETWLKMDDDKVSPMPWKDVDVSGGRSDYHIAIMLLYKKEKILPSAQEISDAKEVLKSQEIMEAAVAAAKEKNAIEEVKAADSSEAPSGVSL